MEKIQYIELVESKINAVVKIMGTSSVKRITLTCKQCGNDMVLLFELKHEEYLYSVYICENMYNPDGAITCDTWDSEKGSNICTIDKVDRDFTFNQDGTTYLTKGEVGEEPDMDIETVDVFDDELFDQFMEITKLKGTPTWIQANETPEVNEVPMTLLMQIHSDIAEVLEDHFGGYGIGYLFEFEKDGKKIAKFLWQC